MEKILEKLKSIEDRLTSIEDRLDRIEHSSKNMDTHIEFVNDTYSTLRGPLNYVSDKYNYYMGHQSKELPNIESKDI